MRPGRAWIRQAIASAARSLLPAPSGLGIGDVHAAELRLPGIECRFRHPMLPTKIGALRSGFMLSQDPDDLLFREPRSLHRPSPQGLRTLASFGRNLGGHSSRDVAAVRDSNVGILQRNTSSMCPLTCPVAVSRMIAPSRTSPGWPRRASGHFIITFSSRKTMFPPSWSNF